MDRRVVKNKDGVYSNTLFHTAPWETRTGARTVLQLFMNNAKLYPDKELFGIIKDDRLVYRAYGEISQDVHRLGYHLERLVDGRSNTIVGIFSVNRPEWVVAEYACYLINVPNCPLFSNFSSEALSDILSETAMEILLVSSDKLATLFKMGLLGGKEKGFITDIIIMDDDHEQLKKCRDLGIKTVLLSEILMSAGGATLRPEPRGDDLATICYTSGTSGSPKGVLHSHENIITNVAAFNRNEDPRMYPMLGAEDVYISYLPLPHVLERICFLAAMAACAKIVFFRGNPKLLQADLKIAKPTFLVTVPRVLNVFMEKIKENVSKKNFLLRGIFNLSLKYKLWRQKSGVYKCWLLDKLIFGKVAKEFGASIQSSLCGGASLNPDVLRFIQAAMCIKIFQGYGQTEGFAANIVMPFDVNDFDSVGIPFPPVQIKLEPVEGFDAYKNENVGQILMRGKSITKGYYKKKQATESLFTEDGWLRTGDVAVERNGFFYIVGRVKDIFKTSFGEYISPEMVELELIDGEAISDIFVTGTKYSNYLIALVVCLQSGVTDDELIRKVREKGEECVRQARLKRYEIPDKIMVLRQPFGELESDEPLVTPSMKKRRNAILRHFEDAITKAYS